MKILVAMSIGDQSLETLKDAAPDCEWEVGDPDSLTHDDCLDADVIIGTVPTAILKDLPRLRLLQLISAGSDNYACLPVFKGEKAPVLANASGAYGVTISEYMIGGILSLLRGFPHYYDQQQKHLWSKSFVPELIFGRRALVLGLGDIGSNFARRINAFGCSVTAIRRRLSVCPDYVESVHTMEELENLLPQADFVACSMPNAPGTAGVINERTLALMKPSAILLNVGRGSAVDADAVAAALNEGRLGGAVLDVFSTEPLPSDHPLWEAPNCIITPHVSGMAQQQDPQERIFDLIRRNICNLREGLPIENEVDITTGYRK